MTEYARKLRDSTNETATQFVNLTRYSVGATAVPAKYLTNAGEEKPSPERQRQMHISRETDELLADYKRRIRDVKDRLSRQQKEEVAAGPEV